MGRDPSVGAPSGALHKTMRSCSTGGLRYGAPAVEVDDVVSRLLGSMFRAGEGFPQGDSSWSRIYRSVAGRYRGAGSAADVYNDLVLRLVALLGTARPVAWLVTERDGHGNVSVRCSHCGRFLPRVLVQRHWDVLYCPRCGAEVIGSNGVRRCLSCVGRGTRCRGTGDRRS